MLHHGNGGRGGGGGGVDGGHRSLKRIALPARVGERDAGLCEDRRAGGEVRRVGRRDIHRIGPSRDRLKVISE